MTDCNIFIYDETEVSYLKKRDKRLAEVIEKVGLIERAVIPDLFAALVNSIIGQQISTKGHKTIWKKMVVALGEITPQVIDSLSDEELQQFGITFKKVAYIKSAAQKVLSGELDIESLRTMSDEEVCAKLVELDGIGIWTAEMLMLFSNIRYPMPQPLLLPPVPHCPVCRQKYRNCHRNQESLHGLRKYPG